MRAHLRAYTTVLIFSLLLAALAMGQAGRHSGGEADINKERGMFLNVTAAREDGSEERVTAKEVSLYDGGQEQTIQAFTPDPTPARIVILVDNSLGLRADVERLQKATREFAYEIYEGDQVMVVGFDQQPEIIADWTDDAKKVEASLPLFRKRGEPHLFDAISAVISDALGPLVGRVRKRVIVLVADGLDRGSRTHFDKVYGELLRQDITVYALQIPDRTGGALRRDQLKPAQAIQKLTEGTGGRVLSVNDSRDAAKTICDELRKNRYVLAYTPTSLPLYDARRLLVLANDGISIRHKLQQPGQ
ncbi:MAG: VWA domain-containing protein [Acidobacteria bacterium]|nr:VWA domain-containing protein [Acidobacteriota bacterium]MBV9924817.1 VWA domain-containing protein [Acidobacteriota bacterium]